MRADGCREVLEVPIVAGGVTLGWLFVGQPAGAALLPPDRALVERLAEETAAALQRTELLERERERARSLALLADENARLLETERSTVARLRQLATHKDGFIDMVAHELRTPLTSIRGFAQMMSRSPTGSAGASRYTSFILTESNRLMGIIDDIVDLSRMERGLLEMNWQSVDLTPMLREVAALAYPNGVRVGGRAGARAAVGAGRPRQAAPEPRQPAPDRRQVPPRLGPDDAGRPASTAATSRSASTSSGRSRASGWPRCSTTCRTRTRSRPAPASASTSAGTSSRRTAAGVWLEHGEDQGRFFLQLPVEPGAEPDRTSSSRPGRPTRPRRRPLAPSSAASHPDAAGRPGAAARRSRAARSRSPRACRRRSRSGARARGSACAAPRPGSRPRTGSAPRSDAGRA